MFVVGAVIFAVFLMGDVSEVKTEEKVTDENYGYYARHQPEKAELKEDDMPMVSYLIECLFIQLDYCSTNTRLNPLYT